MYIEYELTESEKQIAKVYLKRAYMKRRVKQYDPKKSLGMFSLQIFVAASIFLITLSVVFSGYISFTPEKIAAYIVSIFISLVIIGLTKGVVLDKLYLKHVSILKNSHRRRRKINISLDVYNYMWRIERVLNKSDRIRLDIDDDIGKVVLYNGMTQAFDSRTMIHHDIFRGVSFYSFIDSKTKKRCILPIPCGNQEQLLLALL